jgi:hypothetical protein
MRKKQSISKRVRKLVNELDMSPDLAREIVCAQMRRWASMGGRARAQALSAERRREISTRANAAQRDARRGRG